MSSPVDIPFSEFIKIDRRKQDPVYLQIVYQFINAIQRNILTDGDQIPGSRKLSKELGIHRKTMVAALTELEVQGWIDVKPSIGTFIKNIETRDTPLSHHRSRFAPSSLFDFSESFVLDMPYQEHQCEYYFTDGTPDYRIIHTDELSQFYSSALKRKTVIHQIAEYSLQGNLFFRKQLSYYLNLTRGFHISEAHLINSQNKAILLHIISQLLIREGDTVIVAELSHFLPNMIFNKAGAQLRTIPIDQDGIQVDYIRKEFSPGEIKFILVNSQHQYPTTYNLSQERKEKLLALAEEYDFLIIEDDENFELTYERSASPPLIKFPHTHRVIYLGSFGSFLIPGFQTTFLIGPKDFVKEGRKYLNIFGQIDVIKEQAMGDMIRTGDIHRYRRKAIRTYTVRRDYFAELILRHLSQKVHFQIPSGGLAFWVNMNQPTNLVNLADQLKKNGLFIPRTCLYQTRNLCSMRIGFGHLNEKELKHSILLFQKLYKNHYSNI